LNASTYYSVNLFLSIPFMFVLIDPSDFNKYLASISPSVGKYNVLILVVDVYHSVISATMTLFR
jgi:hypothetical protein